MAQFTVELSTPAHEMAREEIRKQMAFLSKDISGVSFGEDGTRIVFEAPEDHGTALSNEAKMLASRVQRALRTLERKIVYHSPAMDAPRFTPTDKIEGVHFLGTGQCAMEGVPLQLFRYFDRVFEAF